MQGECYGSTNARSSKTQAAGNFMLHDHDSYTTRRSDDFLCSARH